LGFFDALVSSTFKTGADGRKLFFPWGAMGKGYAIASEQTYQRLKRQIKTWTVVSFVLILGTNLFDFRWGIGAAALLIALYVGWVLYLLRYLQVSNESLSLNESIKSQALAHHDWVLWLLGAGALVFVICGIIILIIDPSKWLAGVGGIVFFGLCAAVSLRMLVIRYGQSSELSPVQIHQKTPWFINQLACRTYAGLCFFYGSIGIGGGAIGFLWAVYGIPPSVAAQIPTKLSAREVAQFLPLLGAAFLVFGIVFAALGVLAWRRYISAMIVGCLFWIVLCGRSMIHGTLGADKFAVINGIIFVTLTVIAAIAAWRARSAPQQAPSPAA
jgi:hypothetical protein